MGKRFTYYGGGSFACSDPDAVAFIIAHQLATEVQMDAVQQSAICGFVSRLKGNDTTNNNDLWTRFKNDNRKIWTLTPSNDTTASAAGYNVELLSATTLGTFNNFLSGDFTPTGIAGDGVAKYFNSGVQAADYDNDNLSVFVYSREDRAESTAVFGAQNNNNVPATLSTIQGIRLSPETATGVVFRALNSILVNYAISTQPTNGLIGLNRRLSTEHYLVRNNSNYQTDIRTSQTSYTLNLDLVFHGLNVINSTVSPDGVYALSTLELSMYAVTDGLTDDELTDFNDAVQWYQTNVITGGRNV